MAESENTDKQIMFLFMLFSSAFSITADIVKASGRFEGRVKQLESGT